jgi:hypothetical protein
VLDATGARVACADGVSVWVVDTASAVRRIQLTHTAERLAWTPDGVVAVGAGHLTHAGWSRAVPNDAAALAASAGVVAVGYSGEPARVELFATRDGATLGAVDLPPGDLEGLRVTDAHLLAWGTNGEPETDPEWFALLLDHDGTVRWADDDPVQDLLWPILDGSLGIVQERTLTIVRPMGRGGSGGLWDGLGLTAAAPGGALAATLSTHWDGAVDHQVVVVHGLADKRQLVTAELSGVEQHAAVAVDDTGRVTVASGAGADRLLVRTISPKGRVTTTEYRLADPQ